MFKPDLDPFKPLRSGSVTGNLNKVEIEDKENMAAISTLVSLILSV